jgi:hypothetical protein
MRLLSSFSVLALGLAASLSSCGSHSPSGETAKARDDAHDVILLSFSMKPGSKFSYDTQSEQQISTGSTVIKQTINMVNSFAVQPGTPADSATKLDVSYDRVAVKSDAKGQQLAYDSSDPSTKNSPLALMGGLVGKHFTVGLTKAGRVTSVQGMSELVKSTVDPSNPNAVALRAQIGKTLNDNIVKSMMEQSFNIYPNHSVQPGDTWTKVTKLTTGPMTMSATSLYKLKSVSNGVAQIDVSSKLDGEGAMTIAGTQIGTMAVDVATGLLTDGQFDQSLAGAPTMKIVTAIHIKGTKK